MWRCDEVVVFLFIIINIVSYDYKFAFCLLVLLCIRFLICLYILSCIWLNSLIHVSFWCWHNLNPMVHCMQLIPGIGQDHIKVTITKSLNIFDPHPSMIYLQLSPKATYYRFLYGSLLDQIGCWINILSSYSNYSFCPPFCCQVIRWTFP